ncbi:epoxide hydrolase family protein [Actinokineospora bangkokensis]|uniref:Epoxide hydrolase n=1 Tax=Actinokineospora bangkokensis TaxID=1193682 RepID=A0A1Q9LNT0_9PSEU|nr:epoxide hydrolase family protein [Actinokineospora bangkokensis]OLR93680.1 epoxide hydrolase [Actinokineospora bangkokensis]
MTTTTNTTTNTVEPAQHDVIPFTLDVPDSELAALRARLLATRWPDAETVEDTSQGPRLATLQRLVHHWATDYDWRRAERALNGLGQHKTTIDGLDIHFLHVRSPAPDAVPILLTHGWPGSVLEFRGLVDLLVDEYHLVIPSLPGFGFSGRPTTPGWDLRRTARAWAALMARLGYDRWFAQGGDLGAAVTEEIAVLPGTGLVGMHLNMAIFPPTPQEVADADADERRMLAEAEHYQRVLSAYAQQMSTRPQTIGYSLADSPAGLAAWIYGLVQDVTGTHDEHGDPERHIALDELIDGIMLHWLPGTATSAARMYWEMANGRWAPPSARGPVPLPTGVTVMPGEYARKSLRWTQRRYPNLVRFAELPRGGHFAALEQPELLAAEIKHTFGALR